MDKYSVMKNLWTLILFCSFLPSVSAQKNGTSFAAVSTSFLEYQKTLPRPAEAISRKEDTLQKQFAAKKLVWPAKYIYIRSFKYDSQLEVWVKNDLKDPFQLFKSYRICALAGTLIHHHPVHHLPPIIVNKENQALVEMSSKDFSFVGEHHVGTLYHLLEKLKIKPNLTQNTAISFICVLDDRPEKIEKLAFEVSEIFDVQVIKELSLLTIRHYNKDVFEKLTQGKTILLRQQTTDTIQMLMQ